MKLTLALAFCIGLGFALNASTETAPPKQAPPAPAPAALPSVELSKFVGAHLDKILGPLEQHVSLPRAELKELHVSFKARLSKASPAERNQFKAALAVCNALRKAMEERRRSMLGPSFLAAWPQRAASYRQVINHLMEREKAVEGAGSPAPAH
jgi:hypothetical protein